jgi:hypothetical protein
MSEVVIRSKFLDDFAAMERLLVAYQGCIREEEREDIVRDLSGKILAAKEKVLRAEEAGCELLRRVEASVTVALGLSLSRNGSKLTGELSRTQKLLQHRLYPQREGGEG